MVHADHLTCPIRMTNATKATVWSVVWKPSGEPDSITGTRSLDARFHGQWFHIETGLAHNWHRHFDPTTGREVMFKDEAYLVRDNGAVLRRMRSDARRSAKLIARVASRNAASYFCLVSSVQDAIRAAEDTWR